MNTNSEKLARLGDITDVIWQTASHKLREKAREEQAIAARIDDLLREQQVCSNGLAKEDIQPGQMMSTVRWMKWSETERRRINIQLARVRAELARERAQAKRAFGKKVAVEALRKSAANVRPALS